MIWSCAPSWLDERSPRDLHRFGNEDLVTIQSMTGFGQASAEAAGLRVSATLRSVNHRYLDLALRLREDLRALEPELRAHFAARLTRGRVEISIEISRLGAASAEIEVDQALAVAVKQAADALVARGVLDRGPSFGDLMRLSEVVRLRPRTVAWDEDEKATLFAVLDSALDELVAARRLEGAKLAAVLEAHIADLERITGAMRDRAQAWPQMAAKQLAARLETLLADNAGPDPDRLAQEVALLADKSDVREELDRLAAHLEHFRDLMGSQGAIGKRLDFLAQEIFRELNTVGSKCRDGVITRLVLDGKARCEQVREQVQNVE